MLNRHFLTTLLFLFLLGSLPAQAVELGELQTELTEGGPSFVVRDPTQAVLVVQTAIVPLSFESNMGIIRVDNPLRGEYRLVLNAGTNMIIFKNNDYQPLRERFYLPAKTAVVVKVEVKKAAVNEGGRGTIHIETTPSGASVRIDGLPAPDVTPVTIENQLVGVHSLLIGKSGYRDLDTTVRIDRDQTTVAAISLDKLATSLKVTSNPSGARVILDGNEIGTTPLDRSDLSPGEGTLVVSLKGYVTDTRKVRLSMETPKTENIDLFAQTGSVSISSNADQAEIFLDGKLLGSYTGTPLLRDKLALGPHFARATSEGYEDAASNFIVEYNKTTTVNLTLSPKPGAIYITSTPEGADIFLDGKPTGKKTDSKLENVSAGEHEIRLSLEGYGEVEKSVAVRPGKTETVAVGMNNTMKEVEFKHKSGTIYIVTEPEGVAIFLDGINTGKTSPAIFHEIDIGQHSVLLTLMGYSQMQINIVVNSNETITIEKRLKLESFGVINKGTSFSLFGTMLAIAIYYLVTYKLGS